jgi:hypothetical protein
MRYAYHELGEQAAGCTAIVRWQGPAADVLLLDPVNFSKYCDGKRPVRFSDGGHFHRSPARLSVPEHGRWYVVADLGGYSGFAKATVEVVPPDENAESQEVALSGAAS